MVVHEDLGLPPYYALQYHVLYVTRGWGEVSGIAMEEWRSLVRGADDLALDEVYTQHNINRGVDETWREVGRARWSGLPPDEWFHFAPARIVYVHGNSFVGGRPREKWSSILRSLGDPVSLAAWLELIAADRHLEPEPDLELGDGLVERGRARWVSRRGETLHLYRFFPSSIWIYRREGVMQGDEVSGAPSEDRLDRVREIAAALAAQVGDGIDLLRGTRRRR